MSREGARSADGSGCRAAREGEILGPNRVRMTCNHDLRPAVQALPASLPLAHNNDDAVANFLAGLSAMSAQGAIPRSIYGAGAGAGEGGHALPPPKPARAAFAASHAQNTNWSVYTRPVDTVAQIQEERGSRISSVATGPKMTSLAAELKLAADLGIQNWACTADSTGMSSWDGGRGGLGGRGVGF